MATDVDRLCQALSNADYPAEKNDLVQTALRAGADAETVSALEAIPPVTYGSEIEVLSAVPLESKQAEADRAAHRKLHTKPGLSEQDKDIPEHPIRGELDDNRSS
ncbi:DUF2795 domain-containing protein [Haloechinothrix halophila]|uniref:DUF2795 domain-containing protein n=1 Tax=Haloechinothrix halophila TaxID=1069073 RepID=UPI0003F6E918|nr:DUF2795 domain-containing protein [Haloechinothrix halophila]